ncbi:hypothetical protein BDF21DRAFT_394126 [Thamnidium elegans]|uniref:Uncharacterized protein n=1 Tax=Thamnidium elegans TaxID=101142 RepID=A0A8H7SNF8_9FUNG|nr:hypothetical protein INT48_007301 [Thamnidium elegans]KAI8095822.1 hypothetical protein BDF21DRAFT_394126 [Thamnidium elegans]
MYNLKYVLVGIVFATCSLLVDGAENVTTNNIVSIAHPKANQVMSPGQLVIVQYTIHGTPKNGTHQNERVNYPDSLDMILRWTDKKNKTIEFLALNGLNTDPYVDLVKNQDYSHRWKLPNCHFFRRYLPTEWSFSLIFQSQYHEVLSVILPINGTKNHAVVVPLGPEQSDIVVPISVQFNTTLMDDPHHKGC